MTDLVTVLTTVLWRVKVRNKLYFLAGFFAETVGKRYTVPHLGNRIFLQDGVGNYLAKIGY